MERARACLLFSCLAITLSGAAGRHHTRSGRAGCDDDLIRGVNLGGWLLLEPWITPVFFQEVNVGELEDQVVDEWTYGQSNIFNKNISNKP